MTYPELRQVFHVPEGTLRYWASEDKIKPCGTRNGRKAFLHRDFQQAYDKRRHAE